MNSTADPQPPRFGGRLPALMAVALFACAALAFVVALWWINTPGSEQGQPHASVARTQAPSIPPDSARFAQKDECVANKGTNSSPEMIKVRCGQGTLQIISRVEHTSDVSVCRKVKGYQFHYYFDSELPELDFVLCMRTYTS